ncbi:uncharacterized protein TRIADDRAFT_56478 [Trichoplax adhaerens]|uniref:Uncharacterized protein n=1 Tax=Trichoplax adhaerens TaxID=10228 RepID=B3RY91_TRIAD|nr:hypothetical protein TRIADDRAFT_56478 [Trichoplax adhaerens]EDV24558.1 hypothetical protein TRIADDRAFT_56478 [Trichoplax adhaerens]|eukprot:XP_002112448.1 hypothetical protein TRIADDRAFT_56478 [Trichoplax adhaerens]
MCLFRPEITIVSATPMDVSAIDFKQSNHSRPPPPVPNVPPPSSTVPPAPRRPPPVPKPPTNKPPLPKPPTNKPPLPKPPLPKPPLPKPPTSKPPEATTPAIGEKPTIKPRPIIAPKPTINPDPIPKAEVKPELSDQRIEPTSNESPHSIEARENSFRMSNTDLNEDTTTSPSSHHKVLPPRPNSRVLPPPPSKTLPPRPTSKQIDSPHKDKDEVSNGIKADKSSKETPTVPSPESVVSRPTSRPPTVPVQSSAQKPNFGITRNETNQPPSPTRRPPVPQQPPSRLPPQIPQQDIRNSMPPPPQALPQRQLRQVSPDSSPKAALMMDNVMSKQLNSFQNPNDKPLNAQTDNKPSKPLPPKRPPPTRQSVIKSPESPENPSPNLLADATDSMSAISGNKDTRTVSQDDTIKLSKPPPPVKPKPRPSVPFNSQDLIKLPGAFTA